MKYKVSKLSGKKALADILFRADTSCLSSLKQVSKDSEKHIKNNTSPVGIQKQNSIATQKIKKGKPPLFYTGLLATASKYILKKTKRGYQLQPPRGRGKIVNELQEKGYKTVFEVEPEHDMVQKNVDKNYKSLDLNKYFKS